VSNKIHQTLRYLKFNKDLLSKRAHAGDILISPARPLSVPLLPPMPPSPPFPHGRRDELRAYSSRGEACERATPRRYICRGYLIDKPRFKRARRDIYGARAIVPLTMPLVIIA